MPVYLDEQGNEIRSGGGYLDEQGNEGTPRNAANELQAKHTKNIAAGKAAESNWLGPIGTGGAAVVRTAGGMIPGGPLVSEPLAQLYENVAGTRQGFSKGLVAGETALSMIPGGKLAKGALKLAPRIGATAAKVGERAVMGEAATGLPAAIEGQPYTPGLGAAAGVGLGAAAERLGKVRSQGIAGTIGTKVEQAALPSTNRSKKLAYGALSERIGPGTAKAQRLEKEIERGLEPVFDFAANAKRKINNVEDLGSAAKDMAKVTDFEFNQAVDRVGDRLVNGRPVAQEIRDEITDLVRTTNPAQAENLERIAANFDREMPIREVNQLRQEANNVLDKFYAKSPLQQEHPAIGIAAQSGMADGLRKVLYDNLDEIYVDSPSIRQMMRERGAAEGISKYASESSGAARRQGMAETNVRGPVTTPLTWGAKAAKTVVSPYETSKKVAKFAQRPDRKISEAYKLYIPKKARAPIGSPTPLPPKQLPYRTGPDTSGVTPMSQQGAGAQFEAVSQGMGAGRLGQRQLPAFGETEGSTYQALAGRDVNLNQRLLGPGQTVGTPLRNPQFPGEEGLSEASQQLPGGFSQLSEIQPSIERLQTPLRQDVLAGQGYNPNQMFQGGRMRDPAQQSGLADPGAANWGGNPEQITLGELRQLPPEIQNMTLGAVLDQMGLNAKGNFGTVRSFSDTFERTAPSMNAFSPRRQP